MLKLRTVRLLSILLVCVSAIMVIGELPNAAVSAQATPPGWSEPVNLTGWIDEKSGPQLPRITADAAGGVHVIWDGWTGQPPQTKEPSNSIFYATWDGATWSAPIDVITAGGGSSLAAGDIRATQDGRLIMVWTSAGTVLLSEAPVSQAASARQWLTRSIGLGVHPKLVLDEERGRWYVTVVDDGSLRLLVSTDGGVNWLTDEIIWAAPTEAIEAGNDGLTVASDGSLNLAWGEHDARQGWASGAIWHARYLNGNLLDVREVARRASSTDPTIDSPTLAADASGKLSLFWNNGVSTTTGRFFQWSNDNGVTWSETQAVFPGLSGQTRQAGTVFDSSGTLRLISAADGFGYAHGAMRYAFWANEAWSELVTLWPEQFPGEFPTVALTSGNQLHLVWNGLLTRQDGGINRSIIYSSLLLDAPEVQNPGFTPQEEPITIAGSVQPTTSLTVLPTRTPSVTPTATSRVQVSDAQPQSPLSMLNPLIAGVLPAALFVATVLFIAAALKRRTRNRK